MAIQFLCPGCSQPIEVDDEYAGQAATCPYCRRVVTAPVQTRPAVPAVRARPSQEASETAAANPPTAPLSPTDAVRMSDWGGPTLRRSSAGLRPAARTYASYALICALLTAASAVIFFGWAALLTARFSAQHPDRTPSIQELSEYLQSRPESSYLFALELGLGFFGLVGTILAVVSLRHQSRGNWRAWLSLVVCGVSLVCICGGGIVGGMLMRSAVGEF